MMNKDIKDLVNKEKRKQERVKAVHRFAVGVGIVVAAVSAARIIFLSKARKETQDMKKRCSGKQNL